MIATTTMGGLAAISAAQAGPTQAPPNGNPSFPQGPQGPVGPQGPQGNQGNTGNQGAQGDPGSTGLYGLGNCSWYGGEFVSYGWDGYCAWNMGAYFYCDGSRLYAINYKNTGCGDSGTTPGSPFIN